MDKSDTICRVCMDDDGENFTSVFSSGSNPTAAVMIVDCTGIEVAPDDGLPEMICSECLGAIREAYTIRSKCRNTDRKLRKILGLGAPKTLAKELAEPVTFHEIATQTVEILDTSVSEQPQPSGDEQAAVEPSVIAELSEPMEESTVGKVEPAEVNNVPVENLPLDCSPCYAAVSVKQEKNPSPTQAYDEEYLVEELKEITEEEPDDEMEESSEELDAVKRCEAVLNDDQTDKQYIKIEVEALDDELEYENYEAIDEDEETMQGEEPAAAPGSNEPISCCGCPCEFASISELRIHSELIHFPANDGVMGILEEFTCDICYKGHNSVKALAFHKTNRYNKGQRKCTVCQLVLPTVRKKKQHEHLHSTSFPEGFCIKCCGCEQMVPFNQFGLHSEQVHRSGGQQIGSKYICEMCFTDCGSKQLLESHQTKSELFIQQKKLAKPVQLDSTLGIVLLHGADGKQRFVCDICEKNFSTKGNLKSHRALHDLSQKSVFKCSLCDPPRDFSKKSNYNVHILRTHSSSSLCCPDCGKNFKCSINLKTHMRVHTKERPYLCAYCQKTFAHLSDKRRHEIVHSGNYPFKCERCNKPFTRKTVLDRHLESCGHRLNRRFLEPLKSQQKQNRTEKTMMPCDLCEEWFTTVEQLADHHAVMHIQTLDEGTYETEVEIE